MTETDFNELLRLLAEHGFAIDAARFDAATFGSWFVMVARDPPLRVVWDGKDSLLVIQQETSKVFNAAPVWDDLWVGRDAPQHTPQNAFAMLLART